MKKITYILCSLTVLLTLLISCERDYPTPIDIFEEEELTNPFQLPTQQVSNSNELFVNTDRIRQSGDDYHVKGTIFASSQSGTIPVTSGDFLIEFNQSASKEASMSINGYGTFEFPKVGIMEYFDPEVAQGSNIYYNTGSFFKNQSGKDAYPIRDELYYFHYEKDLSNSTKSTNDSTRTRKLKKSKFKFREFFMDVSDPQVYILGDYITPTNTYKDLWMGFSANNLFEFEPYSYSERLEEVVGGLGFVPQNGNFYLAGKVPIQKYPLRIDGAATINTGFGDGGELNFFEHGIESGQFQMGCNGDLYFDDQLIKILKKEYKLAQATIQASFSSEGADLKMAGEYNANYLEDILGDASKYLTSVNNEGRMYVHITDNLDDFLLYVEQKFELNTFNAGDLPCIEGVLKCTNEKFEIHGKLDLPYDIGMVDVVGTIESNGDFKLEGSTEVQLQLTDDLSFNSKIDLMISQEGIGIKGTMNLPYGMGDIDVEGSLTTSGLLLQGSINSNITVTDGFSLPIQLQAVFDSNKGAAFSGSAVLPYGVASIDVEGEMYSDHILLEGNFTGNLEFMDAGILSTHFGAKILVSSTISECGVFLNGGMTLPLDFGSLEVSGEISANDLRLEGAFHGKIPFNDLLSVDLSVVSSVKDGITIQGSAGVSCIATASATVYGRISKDDVFFSGNFAAGADIDVCGVKVDAGANLSIAAGLSYGVELDGGVVFPFGLGNANLNARLQSNGVLSASGEFTSGIRIRDVTLPAANLRFSGSTNTGLTVSGGVDVGFGIGLINLASGSIHSSGFRFKGGDRLTMDFGLGDVSFGCEVEISNNNLSFDFTVVSAEVDWSNHSIKVCIDLIIEEACLKI